MQLTDEQVRQLERLYDSILNNKYKALKSKALIRRELIRDNADVYKAVSDAYRRLRSTQIGMLSMLPHKSKYDKLMKTLRSTDEAIDEALRVIETKE